MIENTRGTAVRAEPVVNGGAEVCSQLRSRPFAVISAGAEKVNVLFFHAGFKKFLQYDGYNKLARLTWPGGIVES